MHSSPSISLYLYLSLLLPLLIPTHAANHLITVGPGLTYTPNTTTAAPGDTLTFHFDPSHHDIAQGEFGKPCDYKPGGFYSGEGAMVPNGHDQFVVTVNDSAPLWFYCSIRGHCQGGMVGVVNVPYVSSPFLSVRSLRRRSRSWYETERGTNEKGTDEDRV
jgi:plastocyanin